MEQQKSFAQAAKDWLHTQGLTIDGVIAQAREAIAQPDSPFFAHRRTLVSDLMNIRAGSSPRLNPRATADFMLSQVESPGRGGREKLYRDLGLPIDAKTASMSATEASKSPWERLFDKRSTVTEVELDGIWNAHDKRSGAKVAVGMRRQDIPSIQKLMDAMGMDREGDKSQRTAMGPKLGKFMAGESVPTFSPETLEKMGSALQFTPQQQQEFTEHYARDRQAVEATKSPRGRRKKQVAAAPEAPPTADREAPPKTRVSNPQAQERVKAPKARARG